MRIHTETTDLYKFSELSESAQETAIEKFREHNEFFSEFVTDDFKECVSRLGVEVDDIFWSGFWSQGDGACFEGSYYYKKGALKAIKEYAPNATELHRIAEELQQLQSSAFYQLTATVKHRGHYYHELCTSIDVERDSENYQEPTIEQCDTLADLLRQLMQYLYSKLEEQYNYENSDECIREILNDYDDEYTINGNRF